MTNRKIIIQILHETTGVPKNELRRIIKAIYSTLPDNKHRLDQERPATEAKDLLDVLRKEKALILRWLHEGAAMARLERMPTQTTRH
jgi:hypothetical protein